MNIQTVASNLRNTIAGKELLLGHYQENVKIGVLSNTMKEGEAMAHKATIEFLEINIDELKRILEDIEKC
jgi:hypothetical protein